MKLLRRRRPKYALRCPRIAKNELPGGTREFVRFLRDEARVGDWYLFGTFPRPGYETNVKRVAARHELTVEVVGRTVEGGFSVFARKLQ